MRDPLQVLTEKYHKTLCDLSVELETISRPPGQMVSIYTPFHVIEFHAWNERRSTPEVPKGVVPCARCNVPIPWAEYPRHFHDHATLEGK